MYIVTTKTILQSCQIVFQQFSKKPKVTWYCGSGDESHKTSALSQSSLKGIALAIHPSGSIRLSLLVFVCKLVGLTVVGMPWKLVRQWPLVSNTVYYTHIQLRDLSKWTKREKGRRPFTNSYLPHLGTRLWWYFPLSETSTAKGCAQLQIVVWKTWEFQCLFLSQRISIEISARRTKHKKVVHKDVS